jgi:hypothetical protein
MSLAAEERAAIERANAVATARAAGNTESVARGFGVPALTAASVRRQGGTR